MKQRTKIFMSKFSSRLQAIAACEVILKDLSEELETKTLLDYKDIHNELLQAEEGIIYPFRSNEFVDAWEGWKAYKKEERRRGYKSSRTEQTALNRLAKICNQNEGFAIETIEHSIANDYIGLYPPKQNMQIQQQRPSAQDYLNSLKDVL